MALVSSQYKRLLSIKRLNKFKSKRQIDFLRAALVGLFAGLLAILFQTSVNYAEKFRDYIFEYCKTLPGLFGYLIFFASVLTCSSVAVILIAKYSPEATGSGIPHIKGVLLHVRVIRWRKLIPIKFISGIFTAMAGFSLGIQGPTVQLGAAVGKAFGDFFKLPQRKQGYLIACGAGAGLSAAFNAPLAGFIFVIEELRKELSTLTYGTALIATVVADSVTRLARGTEPVFYLQEFPSPTFKLYPLVLFIGILCSLSAIVFQKALLKALAIVQHKNYLSRSKRLIPFAIIIATVTWFLPELLGSGSNMIEAFILNKNNSDTTSLTLDFIFLFFLLKFILIIISYLSKVSGGVFVPILTLGICIGLISFDLATYIYSDIQSYRSTMAVIGMACFFSAVVQAPLTAVVLIVEMTGNYNLMFALLLGCLTSYITSQSFSEKPLYEALMHFNLRRRAAVSEEGSRIIDLVIEPESYLEGKLLKDISFPKGSLVILIKRNGQEIVPNAKTKLKAGYEISVILDESYEGTSLEIREMASMLS